jgi:hypothetical protein
MFPVYVFCIGCEIVCAANRTRIRTLIRMCRRTLKQYLRPSTRVRLCVRVAVQFRAWFVNKEFRVPFLGFNYLSDTNYNYLSTVNMCISGKIGWKWNWKPFCVVTHRLIKEHTLLQNHTLHRMLQGVKSEIIFIIWLYFEENLILA